MGFIQRGGARSPDLFKGCIVGNFAKSIDLFYVEGLGKHTYPRKQCLSFVFVLLFVLFGSFFVLYCMEKIPSKKIQSKKIQSKQIPLEIH